MNKKLFWLVTLAGAFARAQYPSKVPKIGFLVVPSSYTSSIAPQPMWTRF